MSREARLVYLAEFDAALVVWKEQRWTDCTNAFTFEYSFRIRISPRKAKLGQETRARRDSSYLTPAAAHAHLEANFKNSRICPLYRHFEYQLGPQASSANSLFWSFLPPAMAFLNLTKVRPNKHAQRSKWNESWENDMKIWQTFAQRPPNLTYTEDSASRTYRLLTQASMAKDLERVRSDILDLQSDARRRIIMRLASNNFAENWASTPLQKRKEYILEAIYKTSSAGLDFEDYRKWCPEITVEGLGGHPQAYLKLLMFFVESEIKVKGETQLTYFPHPVVDSIFRRIESYDAVAVSKFKMDRTLYITMILWRVYLAFVSTSFCFQQQAWNLSSFSMTLTKYIASSR